MPDYDVRLTRFERMLLVRWVLMWWVLVLVGAGLVGAVANGKVLAGGQREVGCCSACCWSGCGVVGRLKKTLKAWGLAVVGGDLRNAVVCAASFAGAARCEC